MCFASLLYDSVGRSGGGAGGGGYSPGGTAFLSLLLQQYYSTPIFFHAFQADLRVAFAFVRHSARGRARVCQFFYYRTIDRAAGCWGANEHQCVLVRVPTGLLALMVVVSVVAPATRHVFPVRIDAPILAGRGGIALLVYGLRHCLLQLLYITHSPSLSRGSRQ